jgi:hypothetical protein
MIDELTILKKQTQEIGYDITVSEVMSVLLLLLDLIDILINNEKLKMDDYK